MTLNTIVTKLRKLPADKQAYISRLVLQFESEKLSKKKMPQGIDLLEVLDDIQFSSGDGRFSENVELFTGRDFQK